MKAAKAAGYSDKTAYYTTQPIRGRLRASELLAKAEGDFLERVTVENKQTLDLRGEVRLALFEREKERRTAAIQTGEAED